MTIECWLMITITPVLGAPGAPGVPPFPLWHRRCSLGPVRFSSPRFNLFCRAVTLLFVLCGCLAAGDAQAKKPLRVALVLPGSTSDKGFNEVAYLGLLQIEKNFGAAIVYSENTPMANYERVIRGFADDGNDVIICRGLEFGDLAKKIAPDYPKQFFVVSDGHEVSGANVVSIEPRTRDAAFLAGILAGLTTKTNKVGAVIGFDFPLIVADVEVFRWALRSVNPNAELKVIYLGSFDDVARGKEAALEEINEGCDVLYHIADTAGIGVIQGAAEKGVKIIGYGSDQNHLAPQVVFATEISDPQFMMLDIIQAITEKRFDGRPRVYGLDSPCVALAIAPNLVPPAVRSEVDRWKEAITSGKLVVPLMTERDSGAKAEPLHLNQLLTDR
jgi:basic membrane protein A